MATAQDNLARKQIYIPALQPEAVVLRVAAYCRVSTDSEDQLNSFAAQQSYYNDYIRKHDNWQLAEIYADEGITGTSAAKRDDFQRMLSDCRKGRIDKVLVKSISRFARNTKECLESIRELKALGISVFFEEHNIDTRMVTSEMLTAILASCAQAESESISKNMRWSYQKRMLSGTYIPSSAPYGYRLINKQIVVEPDEAVAVVQIFTLYLAGYSKLKIAAILNSRSILTRKGNPWDYCAIRYILRNERYAGNSLWQKTYKTEDFPPKKLRNYGERERYYAENTHPAIIEMDAFSAVKELLEERRSFYKEGIRTVNPVRDRLICGHCGSRFRGKTVEGNQYWCCRTHSNDASTCPTKAIPAEEIAEAFLRLWYKLKNQGNGMMQYLLKNLYTIRNRQMLWGADIIELNKRISDIISQSHKLTAMQKSGNVDPDIFIAKSNQLAEQLRQAKQQKERLQHQEDDGIIEATEQLLETINAGPAMLESFDEELFCELIDKIIVESNTRIRFRLKNGLELPETIERTVR